MSAYKISSLFILVLYSIFFSYNMNAKEQLKIHQSLNTKNVRISGESGTVKGVQVITINGTEQVEGNQVISLNNGDVTCLGMSIMAESDGNGKISIYSNQLIMTILPAIGIKLQNVDFVPLNEADVIYEVVDKFLKVELRNTYNLNNISLAIKNDQSKNRLIIPFDQKMKITQSCSATQAVTTR
ncbi:MAG: hypothetical protein HC877_17615 [Thioploca sp.]|nr:hypothetical protein [Thioploca sp.]